MTSPTPTNAAAMTALNVIDQIFQGNKAWGTYHYCGDSHLSWYEYAQLIAKKWNH